MDTRSTLKNPERCAYCEAPGVTNDHTPPKCFLTSPRPSNLVTLPSCQKCNSDFSFDENLVRGFLTMIGRHPLLIEERQPGGRLERARKRDKKLAAALDGFRRDDGVFEISGNLVISFQRVFIKTVQGLFFGLYNRLAVSSEFELLNVSHIDQGSAEEAIAPFQPSILVDISDEPLSEITPRSWHSRQPIMCLTIPSADGQMAKRVFRLKRETKLKWEVFQPTTFRFATFEHEDGRLVCVIELWQSLVVQVATPWPASQGPLRKKRRTR